jgi:N-acetylmuramoyl-L-alanine amidase
MILLMKRKTIRRISAAIAAGILAGVLFRTAMRSQAMISAGKTVKLGTGTQHTYVIDPGHGGEDGGAVARDGTAESSLNLRIGERLCYLIRFCGQPCGMTRNSDISVYSEGAATLREKKVSDLKNRVAMVNRTPDAFLVSIHQNFLPAAGVHGAQVFFNERPGAKEAGMQVQECLNQIINTARPKAAKPIAPTIYLMKNIQKPGVLVECGFLSNPAEKEKLKLPAYQTLLAVSIASGILHG